MFGKSFQKNYFISKDYRMCFQLGTKLLVLMPSINQIFKDLYKKLVYNLQWKFWYLNIEKAFSRSF